MTVPRRLPGHRPAYRVERDPDEGNYWTVSCECGFEEHGSTREVVRDEHAWHRGHVLRVRAVKLRH